MLENVQIRATKLVDGMKNMTYTERLEKLDIPTLLYRRERGDMIQVWNHFHTYDRSTLSPNFRPLPRTIRKHPFQLTWNRPKDGTHGRQKNSFYFRISNKCNLLPRKVVEAENVDTFNSTLDAAWTNHQAKFTIEIPSATEDQERFLEAL